jgi:hypothetical protein
MNYYAMTSMFHTVKGVSDKRLLKRWQPVRLRYNRANAEKEADTYTFEDGVIAVLFHPTDFKCNDWGTALQLCEGIFRAKWIPMCALRIAINLK